VVAGVVSDRVRHGYGWIKKGGVIHQFTSANKLTGMKIYTVSRFMEKPDTMVAQKAFLHGWLVNTLILVGKAAMFLNLFKQYTPELYNQFLRARQAFGSPNETEVLREAFESIPMVNFSKAIMERISGNFGVMPLQNVYWNDWGEEDRVREDLLQLRRDQTQVFQPSPMQEEQERYTIELSLL
jgi:mannose-1-phosphate guanylyltransferase